MLNLSRHSFSSSSPTDSSKREAWRWLIAYLTLLCLGLTVAVRQPPFYIPDEGAHFLRAYEVSRLHIVNARGSVGTNMPCLDYAVVATKYHLIAWAQTKSTAEQHLPDCTTNTRNTAGAYSFIPYIPAALAMRVAEFLEATVEHRLIASRAASLLVWITLIFVALRGLRSGMMLMGCLVLLPSFFWQLAAVSADGATLAACLIYVLIVLRSLQTAQVLPRSVLTQLLLVATLIGSSKGVYAPLCLFSFALWNQVRTHNTIFKLALLFLPTVACLIVFVFFAGLADPSLVYLGNGANPALQIEHVLRHPLRYMGTVFGSIGDSMNIGFISPSYAIPNTGRGFGITVFALLSCGTLLMFSSFEANRKIRLLAAAIAFILCVAVCLPLYLTYNPVAQNFILGLQSRYFLPILPMMFIALAFDSTKVDWVRKRSYARWAPLLPLAGLFLACINIP